jgi:ADP-ribose pyrophosphatase YjhB (NUDIX family)
VRGVVFSDAGEILLVREKEDGRWTVPGGWPDVQTSPAENVVNEIEEESGFRTRPIRLLAVYDRSRHPHEPPFPYHVYKLFFQCEIVGGEARANLEASEVAFFAGGALPELSASRVLPEQIHRFSEHRRNPHLPTDFD